MTRAHFFYENIYLNAQEYHRCLESVYVSKEFFLHWLGPSSETEEVKKKKT